MALVIQDIERAGLHHISVRVDRLGDMGEIVPVLRQLFTDPLFFYGFALELNVQDAVTVAGELEQVEFLAYVRDGIGEIESVQK